MTISQVYDMLPMSSRTLWKRINSYPFKLVNDLGRVDWFRVVVNGEAIGVIQYDQGRKLVCHGTPSKLGAETLAGFEAVSA